MLIVWRETVQSTACVKGHHPPPPETVFFGLICILPHLYLKKN